MKNSNHIDCFQCKHFYITWDQSNPKGCNAFGFKTRRMPSHVVFESSGEPCLKFSPKQTEPPPPKPKKGGWVA